MRHPALILAVLISAASAHAAIWPDPLGDWQRRSAQAFTPPGDPKIWMEFGLESAEQAVYFDGKAERQVTAIRLQDSTGALAASDWVHGVREGNYVLQIGGTPIPEAQLRSIADNLPKRRNDPPPNLPGYLPSRSQARQSARYVLGPESLHEFLPQVPSEVAGFNKGAEAAMATYQWKGATFPIAIFSYPTPQIARARVGEFEKLPGTQAVRTGPFVAVSFGPPAARPLLDSIRYEAVVTLDEAIPKKQPNVGTTMLSIFALAGILILLCLVGGIGAGITRVYATRFGSREAESQMISLGLREK